ncbi:MAG: YhjD/YihY/BrkB family envelope integrity protein [Planctomycetota bacterium]
MRIQDFLTEAIRSPRAELSRRQHQVRFGWDLMRHCARQTVRHRADGMAAELTYRTIFSLIPVVVLGLVLFRVFGGLEDVQTRVENQLFSFFGVPEIPLDYIAVDSIEETSSDTMVMPGNPSDESSADSKARASIRKALQDLTDKIATVDFTSIGVLGLMLFVYAAVALANAIEYLFNIIYHAPKSRPIHIRLAIHWSIITLGSGLLAISLYMSGQVIDWFGAMVAGSSSIWLLQHLLSLLAGWVLMFLLFALMPNTTVSVRAAAIGAAVAALLWEIAKYGFQIYVSTAVPYSALYGSLGLIPLFLFWIYVTWIIVLFGLILTHTLQVLRGRSIDSSIDNDAVDTPADPDWMIPMLTEIAAAFSEGDLLSRQTLSQRLGMPINHLRELEVPLIEQGYLRRFSLATDNDALILARPAESITLQKVISLAQDMRPSHRHPVWRGVPDLNHARCAAVEERTIADMIADAATAGDNDVASSPSMMDTR